VRESLAGGVGVEGLAERLVAVPADRRVDATRARARPPTDEREVLPLQTTLPNELLQPAVGLLGPRGDEQPGRIAVEAVDDARALRVAAGDASVEERVDERPALVPGRRMDNKTCRFVDDEQMLVLVGDPQFAGLGLERRDLRNRDLHLDLLPTFEPEALRTRLAVDLHRARAEEPFGLRARVDLRQRRDEAVEPLTRSFCWNDD
jgi:hypothetical protein